MQLQRGSGDGAERDRTDASGDDAAAGGDAECGDSAGGGRTDDLSDVAGVHGELYAQAGEGRRDACGRMLRDDSELHAGDEECAAGDGCDGAGAQVMEQRSESTVVQTKVAPPPLAQRSKIGAMIAAGEFVTMVEIVSPKGIDCSQGD